MRRFLIGLALVFALASPGQGQAQNQAQPKTGIVLMHGWRSAPDDRLFGGLHAALLGAGYLVEMPEMCWSNGRVFDESLLDCFADIDAAIARLKAQGATEIVISGHSLGGSAALAYGARHEGLKGIIAMAPAPDPSGQLPDVAFNLDRAQQLIDSGQGDQKILFTHYNHTQSGYDMTYVFAAPRALLSFDAAHGPAEMSANLAALKAPLLWIAGKDDDTQNRAYELFMLAPKNPLNRLIKVNADHNGTPQAAIPAVLDWLAGRLPN
jgi:pimeloyl-ACP methyl ester carboxylesterase